VSAAAIGSVYQLILILVAGKDRDFSFAAIRIDVYLQLIIGIYFLSQGPFDFRVSSRHIVGHPTMKERLR
jgi:hypothetical protein